MSRLLSYLRPRLEEEDPGFKEEIRGLAVIGLRIIAWMSVGANVIAYALMLLWLPAIPQSLLFGDVIGAVAVLVALLVSYWAKAGPYARAAGMVLLYVATVGQMIGTSASSLAADAPFDPSTFMPIMMAITMMLALVALPLKPLHALILSGSITVSYHLLSFGRVRLRDQDFIDAMPILVMVMVTLTSIALAAVVYHQRAHGYLARREAQESLEALQHAQRRLLVSETASSQNRFAAALSHELNTPLGSLASSLTTIESIHRKSQESAVEAERLEPVFSEAVSSSRLSLERLNETLGRMKRVTNLDRSEERSIDLNELWRDTLTLLAPELSTKAELRLELSEIPEVVCRPQQMAAVFSNLVTNAATAVNGNGTVIVSSSHHPDQGEILVQVSDDGPGMTAEALARLFDPGFTTDGGRVRSSWSMFVSRGIVTEHGGHIEVDSEPGRGTTARIFLPVGR